MLIPAASDAASAGTQRDSSPSPSGESLRRRTCNPARGKFSATIIGSSEVLAEGEPAPSEEPVEPRLHEAQPFAEGVLNAAEQQKTPEEKESVHEEHRQAVVGERAPPPEDIDETAPEGESGRRPSAEVPNLELLVEGRQLLGSDDSYRYPSLNAEPPEHLTSKDRLDSEEVLSTKMIYGPTSDATEGSEGPTTSDSRSTIPEGGEGDEDLFPLIDLDDDEAVFAADFETHLETCEEFEKATDFGEFPRVAPKRPESSSSSSEEEEKENASDAYLPFEELMERGDPDYVVDLNGPEAKTRRELRRRLSSIPEDRGRESAEEDEPSDGTTLATLDDDDETVRLLASEADTFGPHDGETEEDLRRRERSTDSEETRSPEGEGGESPVLSSEPSNPACRTESNKMKATTGGERTPDRVRETKTSLGEPNPPGDTPAKSDHRPQKTGKFYKFIKSVKNRLVRKK